MCRVLNVSRSGYSKWKKNIINKINENERIDMAVKEVFNESKNTYGSPRVTIELKNLGYKISEYSVAKRMQLNGLVARPKKVYLNTTDPNHDYVTAKNLLNRQFKVDKINTVWVSDITYIKYGNKTLYLTVIIDLADRMVVGWCISDNMTAVDTTMCAFKNAVIHRNLSKENNLLFHSDRSVQYACHDFVDLLLKYECRQSMSRKGNCWDNAPSESFFKSIKVESLYKNKFGTKKQVYTAVFKYIEGWYNTKRIHTSLNGKSPLSAFYELIHKFAA
jgi:putative transposase